MPINYLMWKLTKKIIYIIVKSDHSNIYQYKNVTYKRTGSSTHALSYDETKMLEKQRVNHVSEIAPNVFRRVAQGEYYKCSNCGYSESIGLSVSVFSGGHSFERKCPKCGSVLIKYS